MHHLIDHAYDDLRSLAERYLARERVGHTLQATALVHEAFLKIDAQDRTPLNDPAHLVAIAATAMRRVLVNHAVARKRTKRGGGRHRVVLDTAMLGVDAATLDLVQLDEALERLTDMDARQGRIVELRFFGGLEETEIAELLDISPRTVRREWAMARAWLRTQLRKDDQP